ncbi:MAG: LamG-like jellyroll fold domain-containing protein [Pseudomonadota bacterium]
MGIITDGLQLYLELSELKDDKSTPDISGHDRHGIAGGSTSLVTDDLFGSCLSLMDTQSLIRIPGTERLCNTGDVTVEAWFCSSSPFDRFYAIRRNIVDSGQVNLPVFSFGLKPYKKKIEWLSGQPLYEPRFFFEQGVATSQASSAGAGHPMKLNWRDQWYHLVGVMKNNKIGFRLHDQDGKDCGGSAAQLNRSVGTQQPNTTPLEIAFETKGTVSKSFSSSAVRVARVRLYDRALSEAEIEQNIRADLEEASISPPDTEPEDEEANKSGGSVEDQPLSGYRAEYPIDFRLYDDDQQSVFYIDNGPKGANGATGYPLHLELHNRSGRDITFKEAVGSTAMAESHHLELQFRAGTLSPNTLQALKEAKVEIEERVWGNTPSVNRSAWGLGVSDSKHGEPVSLYLLRQGPDQVLAADQRCELTLTPMAAGAGQGARGAQVTLRFNQMTFAGAEGSPVVADRTKQLYIGHVGRRNVPLHVGFLGPNSNRIPISQDHPKLRKLTLGITNTHPKNAIASQSGAKAKLILKFDYGSQPWDLCSGEAAESLTVSRKWPAETTDTRVPPFERGQGEKPEWRIEFPPQGLQPGERVEVQIDFAGIPHANSGDTNLYLDYENIPGYGEGRFICTVTRSPLICTDKGVDIHGGLTVSPESGDSLKITSAGDVHAASVTSSGNIEVNTGEQGEDSVAKITSSGEVSAAKITSSGEVSAAKITSSGEVSAAKITSSGEVSAAKIMSSGDVHAASVTSNGNIVSRTGMVEASTIISSGEMRVGDKLHLQRGRYKECWTIEIDEHTDRLGFFHSGKLVAWVTTKGDWHKKLETE